MRQTLLALPALLLLAASPATDADMDGQISLGEMVMTFERQVAAADANADGYLSKDELAVFTKARRDVDIVDEFDLFDADRNGVLDLEEYELARAKTDPFALLHNAFGIVASGAEEGDNGTARAELEARLEAMKRRMDRAQARTLAFLALPTDYDPGAEMRDAAQAELGMSIEMLRYGVVSEFMTLDRNEDRKLDRRERLTTNPLDPLSDAP